MLGLRGTDNFIWSVGDAVGNGITGTVYKCREKKKGKPFAAKVLNANSEMRPYEIRMRETEVLRKLSHPNIVQLFALEKERGSQAMVIIMELCERSLYEVLEEPQNMNGFNEQDYIEVIRDVSSGMEYLRASNVVHRDVKPGNILVSQKDNGKNIYKISDFGTARELGHTDEFTSYAYGTEEYLHPDLYERAVMRMSKSKVFNSTVDLWSLGVTFYHLATGELPFQPHGGRQNKEVMFQMITEKKPGVISCRQNATTKTIINSSQLPTSTQLTDGLRNLITPVLAGLLETDPEYMISHDECFKKIRNIVDRKAVDVFFTKSSTIHRLYLQQEDNYTHLQEVIQREIGVNINEQKLLHNYQQFQPDPMSPILHYPEITRENPLILDTKQYIPSIDIPVTKLPIVQITPRGSLDDDAKLGKLYACLSHTIKHETDTLLLTTKAIASAHDILEFETLSLFKQEKQSCKNLRQSICDKWKRIVDNKQLLLKLSKTTSSEDADVVSPHELQKFNAVVQLLAKLDSEFSDIFENKVLMEEWFATRDNLKLLPWNNVIIADMKTIEKIFHQFFEDRRRQVNNLDELTHRYEKDRLSQCYQRLQSQHSSLTEHRNTLHDQFVKWLILLNHRRGTMVSLKEQLDEEFEEFETFYQAEIVNFENEVARVTSVCTHDFKKLEKELFELDCIPDLLTMVHDQGEKLKMLQEIDAQENDKLSGKKCSQ